jgi:hypothetical protein
MKIPSILLLLLSLAVQTLRACETRIFYFLQAHNERTLQDVQYLLPAIDDPCNTLLLHVDTKARDLLGDLTLPSTVRVESKFRVKWSHWSMNLPTLWALQVAVDEYSGAWDVWINLSADSWPVYTINTTAEFLSELPYNFVTSKSCETGLLPTNVYHFPTWWHKRKHYTADGQDEDPVLDYWDEATETNASMKVVTHFGSQWMILQADFCAWLVQELAQSDSWVTRYRDYLRDSGRLMSDETFIPTVIQHSTEFRQTLPQTDAQGYLLWRNGTQSNIQHVRFERMDEHVPSAWGSFPELQRYDVPEGVTVDKPRSWGPYYLGVYDLGEIRRSGALFIRKVTTQIDPNVPQLLPVERSEDIPLIDWPDHVAIVDKPHWEDDVRELYAEMVAEARHERHSDEEL